MNRFRLLLLIVVVLLSGATAFWVARAMQPHAPPGHERSGPRGEVAWMKAEYGLSDEQFRKVEELHLAYIPRCEENCCRIDEAGARVRRLAEEASGMNDELAAAIREEEKVRADCRLALMAHLYQTASQMPPDAGRRFLRSAMTEVCPTAHPNVHGAVAH